MDMRILDKGLLLEEECHMQEIGYVQFVKF
jgi:hypothetical protein